MSIMAKYLRQTCSWETVQRDEYGKPIMNNYGELTYNSPVTIKCRRERYIKDVETPTGAVLKSDYEYYTVNEVGLEDRLDGKVILTSEEYTNGQGLPEGYRSIT